MLCRRPKDSSRIVSKAFRLASSYPVARNYREKSCVYVYKGHDSRVVEGRFVEKANTSTTTTMTTEAINVCFIETKLSSVQYTITVTAGSDSSGVKTSV